MVGFELVQDHSATTLGSVGFLRRFRLRIKALLNNGLRTETYFVDYSDRGEGLRDAVAVLPFAVDESDEVYVLLRRQPRYPVFVASQGAKTGVLECVAGLIEGDESIEHAAQRETHEEVGLKAELNHFIDLGPSTFLSPGVIPERVSYRSLRCTFSDLSHAVDNPPPTDGSPYEIGAEIVLMPLKQALLRNPKNDDHGLADAKTEVALRRLKEDLERAKKT